MSNGWKIALVLVLGACFSQYRFEVNRLEGHIRERDQLNLELRRELENRMKLSYLAVNYGTDARQDPSRRLLPLEHFSLPLEDRPLWLQADDALIQFIGEPDSLRVDAWRVVSDTTASYLDKSLFSSEAFNE